VSADIQWAIFVGAALALALTPGPDMIYVVSRALAQGPRAGLVSAAGLTLGLAAHILLAALGVSVLLRTSETAFMVLKIAGALYLIWIGIQLWRATPSFDVRVAVDRAGTAKLFLQGSLSALLNPKLALFFLAFLPQFVPRASATPTLDALSLGLVFAVIGIAVQACAGLAAGLLSERLRRSDRALRGVFRTSGLVMMVLGARLLFAPR
jgi:threonine/homoserine/homoserine lactone efflux protein